MPRGARLTGSRPPARPGRVRSPGILLAGLACLGASACAGERGPPPDERPADIADAPAGRAEQGVDTLDVFLEEYRISMPRDVGVGSVLRIVNVGVETHNLRFRLPGTDSVLQETAPDLNPGETRYLEVAVPPGAYSVVCDFGGHSGRGMRTDAVVIPRPAGG